MAETALVFGGWNYNLKSGSPNAIDSLLLNIKPTATVITVSERFLMKNYVFRTDYFDFVIFPGTCTGWAT